MVYATEYKAVNWQNGMKITSEHLNGLEDWMSDSLRDVSSHWQHYMSYGLLPLAKGHGQSLDLAVEGDALVLRRCHALTPNGTRIAIDESHAVLPSMPLEKLRNNIENYHENTFVFDVWLAANPFGHVPVGSARPGDPSRQPFTIPKYDLEAIPVGQLNGKQQTPFHLLIGKLVVKGVEFVLDEQFVPPCTSVESHPKLLDFHGKMVGTLTAALQNAILTNNKIRRKPHKSLLEVNINYLAERLAFVLADTLDCCRTQLRRMPPEALVGFALRLARNMTVALEMTDRRDRVLEYFSDWTRVPPGEIEAALRHLLELDYDHNDTAGAMSRAEQFVQHLSKLFSALPQLDYVEKRQDDFIVD